MQYTIDATNKKIGRLASEAALILQGKKSPAYNPRLIGEDYVLVKNIDKIEIPVKKTEGRIYYRHTGPLGHLKEQSLKMLIEKKGKGAVLRKMVMAMLPKNKLRAKRIKKLTIE